MDKMITGSIVFNIDGTINYTESHRHIQEVTNQINLGHKEITEKLKEWITTSIHEQKSKSLPKEYYPLEEVIVFIKVKAKEEDVEIHEKNINQFLYELIATGFIETRRGRSGGINLKE